MDKGVYGKGKGLDFNKEEACYELDVGGKEKGKTEKGSEKGLEQESKRRENPSSGEQPR